MIIFNRFLNSSKVNNLSTKSNNQFFNVSFEAKLERSPKKDVLVREHAQKVASTLKNQTKTIKPADLSSKTIKKYESIKKERILTDEVMYFLQPQEDAKGNKVFTKAQTEIIWHADAKVAFLSPLQKN